MGLLDIVKIIASSDIDIPVIEAIFHPLVGKGEITGTDV
jgi:hypothetical protein